MSRNGGVGRRRSQGPVHVQFVSHGNLGFHSKLNGKPVENFEHRRDLMILYVSK